MAGCKIYCDRAKSRQAAGPVPAKNTRKDVVHAIQQNRRHFPDFIEPDRTRQTAFDLGPPGDSVEKPQRSIVRRLS